MLGSAGDDEDRPGFMGGVPGEKTSSVGVTPCSSTSEWVGKSPLLSSRDNLFLGFLLGLLKSNPPASSEAYKFNTSPLFPPFLAFLPVVFVFASEIISGALLFLPLNGTPLMFAALCAGIGYWPWVPLGWHTFV